MNKLNIYKNDEKVVFKLNEEEEKEMTFDNLKVFANYVLSNMITEDGKNIFPMEYECEDGTLILYKNTFMEIISSIISDEELIQILNDKEKED